jgi:peptidoglycan/xylan/chitin deacetylase (PgdA/CDA1 family)
MSVASPRQRLCPRAAVAAWLTAVACAALAAPASAQQAPPDACPNGWSAEQTVAFSPHGPDSGVLNPTGEDGCTLLDVVWNAEPFSTHGDFLRTVAATASDFERSGLLTGGQAGRIVAVATRTPVGGSGDDSIDNSCPNRIAITFDDGPSVYRAQTLRVLRERQVPATFFDLGMRVDANPQLARFEAGEGHPVLNHTYSHPNLTQISLESVRRQILETEAALTRAGAPMPFKVLRPPFVAANAQVIAEAAALGYTVINPVQDVQQGRLVFFSDWLLATTADRIRTIADTNLRPGVTFLLHDGPVDSPTGAAVVDALPDVIDDARARGFCFGQLDRHGQVVAARHVPTGAPIPSVTHPVPYLPLIDTTVAPPQPYVIVTHPF